MRCWNLPYCCCCCLWSIPVPSSSSSPSLPPPPPPPPALVPSPGWTRRSAVRTSGPTNPTLPRRTAGARRRGSPGGPGRTAPAPAPSVRGAAGEPCWGTAWICSSRRAEGSWKECWANTPTWSRAGRTGEHMEGRGGGGGGTLAARVTASCCYLPRPRCTFTTTSLWGGGGGRGGGGRVRRFKIQNPAAHMLENCLTRCNNCVFIVKCSILVEMFWPNSRLSGGVVLRAETATIVVH